jgi:hypothetical protein
VINSHSCDEKSGKGQRASTYKEPRVGGQVEHSHRSRRPCAPARADIMASQTLSCCSLP